jgi:hypothetical protein
MVETCANHCCAAVRRSNQGKLFRLDIDLGSRSGEDEQMTEYIWLCASCAKLMHPKVEVTAESVILRLARNDVMPVPDNPTNVLKWAN